MGRQFEIRREVVMQTTPEEIWDAVTTGTGAWLWPMEVEPREGGQAAFGGVVTVWDPPRHLVTRVDGPDGWFNELEELIEDRGDGKTFLRYVHSGIMTEDWDNQYDGASQHTDFYLHTLEQYLLHFSRRPVTYAAAEGPAASRTPDAFAAVHGALGLPDDAGQGATVRVDLPGVGPVDAVVDYRQPNFLGLRTGDAMYRFFGRNAFAQPVGLTVHLFGDATDQPATEHAWQSWLDDVYGG
jgi:uncharacterized protein YndB with AHSA1/START domain